ncbi:MAG: protoporphyrinogen oxidase [Bryobacteraceae bacterium]|nr:protoporphyrinogen oxidase [Bryobacteraceae bacterium]
MGTVIVGGGITGLAAAHTLAKAGHEVTLIERSPRLGGVISTSTVEGCVVEGGPDSFLAAKPAAMQLIRELGLESEVISSNDHERVTYIWKDGRLIAMPDGLMMMVPTKILPMTFSPLLGWGTKIRMGLELFRRPPATPRPDRSVADFIREHYGQETVDYLAEPLLAGVYGGDPEELSVGATLQRFVDMENKYGSLTRGTLEAKRKAPPGAGGALFRTLKGGMGQLVDKLAAELAPKIRLVTGGAAALERQGELWRLRVQGDSLTARHVILATPAWQAAELLRTTDPAVAGLLDQVGYNSSMTIALGYRAAEARHAYPGFGFLVPKVERQFLAAATFVGTKFSHRVPADLSLIRCFAGGEAKLALSDSEIVAAARADLERIIGLRATPIFTQITRWPRSMAQYRVGHAQRMAELMDRARSIPQLSLAGNAYQGIGIPDCIQSGQQAAQSVLAGTAKA